MMRRAIWAALPVLAACAAPEPAHGPQRFRAEGTPIYSNAVLAPAQLAGTWRQVAEFAAPDAPPCAARGVTVGAASATALTLDADLCSNGRRESFRGPAPVSGPGRLRPEGADPAGLGAEWWLLWVDVDMRTAVIGTPSGQFGFILNRDPVLPADRAAAARDILAWNGYDLSRLRMMGGR